MREDDFSGMKFLRGSDVFGATKFLTHHVRHVSVFVGSTRAAVGKDGGSPGEYTFSSHHDPWKATRDTEQMDWNGGK